MSMNFEERRYHLKNDFNNIKINNNKNKKNNQKKINLGASQELYNISNSPSQNNKNISPSFKNVINSKNKKQQYQNRGQNTMNDQFNLIQKLNKKKKEENNYKHNKSFEDNAINNDILLQYKIESPLIPGNLDNCGNEIIEILNLNGNNGNGNQNNKIKKLKNKKLNNSYILESKFKSMINDNNNNFIDNKINNLNNYNNNSSYKNNKSKDKDLFDDEIDHKELIIGSNDKNDKYKNYENNLEKNNLNVLNNNNDENLLDSSFENNKSDFCLLYTDNYHKNINNDMLTMEIQLFYEKILELQKSYHNEIKKLYKIYNDEKKLLKLVYDKKILLKKKIINLLNLKEKRNIIDNNNAFFGNNIKKSISNDSSKINKNEILLLNKMFPIKEIIDEKNYKKTFLKQIFKKVVFDRYKSISFKLNDVEKNIINSLIKKYKYNEKANNNNNNINNINNKKLPNNTKNSKSTYMSKSTNRNNKGNQNKNSKKFSGISFNKNHGNINYRKNIFH